MINGSENGREGTSFVCPLVLYYLALTTYYTMYHLASTLQSTMEDTEVKVPISVPLEHAF